MYLHFGKVLVLFLLAHIAVGKPKSKASSSESSSSSSEENVCELRVVDFLARTIFKVNLDDLSVEDLNIGIPITGGIAVDSRRERMFFISSNVIYSSYVDGTDMRPFVTLESGKQYRDLAVDVENDRLFVTEMGGIYSIRYWGDHTPIQIDLVPNVSLSALVGIKVDSENGTFYWADSSGGYIARAEFDGSSAEIILSGLTGASHFDLDLHEEKIYYESNNEMFVADLDGSNNQQLFATDPWFDINAIDDYLFVSTFAFPPSPALVRLKKDGSSSDVIGEIGNIQVSTFIAKYCTK